MKKLLMILFVFGMFQIGTAQKVNDKIKINYEGKWYPGTIEKINAEKKEYYVAYDGWGDDMKEWVKIDRIKVTAAKTSDAKVSGKAK